MKLPLTLRKLIKNGPMAFTLTIADCQITGSPVYKLSYYIILMRLIIVVRAD